MDYLELSVSVRPEAVEAAAELLRRHVPAGVSIDTPFEALDEEGGFAFDGAAPVRLRAWLPEGGASRSAVAALRRDLKSLAGIVRPLRARTVRDTWVDAWKRQFRVLRIGRRLVIRPSWRRYRARRDDVVIDLDPGMAFGTGQHATTQMCLEALERRITPGATVLDVGCGSGILAVAAALLGAAGVDAVDIDPAAVRATAENGARNGVTDLVRVKQGSVGEAWPFRARPNARYDIVLANLSSRLVQELACPLVEALRPGGVALVSGIIAEQEAACRAALEPAGGATTSRRKREGWVLLTVVVADALTARSSRSSRTRDRR